MLKRPSNKLFQGRFYNLFIEIHSKFGLILQQQKVLQISLYQYFFGTKEFPYAIYNFALLL